MKKKIAILLLLIVMLTGCTKRVTVKNEETNTQKSVVVNILCRPETEELINTYDNLENETKIDLGELPACKDLKINSGGYEGLWTSLFVKPLAWFIVKVGLVVKNNG